MQSSFKIGICQNLKMWNHFSSWTPHFIEACQKQDLEYEIIDPYANSAIDEMKKCTHVIWPIQNYLFADLLEARNILYAVEHLGIINFPNFQTAWHFDDKIAEMYAFKAIDAPIPQSWVFYNKESSLDFLAKTQYPIVAKLRNGSGASNVKLLKSETQAKRYIKRMFGRGFDPSPSLLYKAYSHAQSSRSWRTIVARIKKIPQFLYTLSNAKMMPIEKGYCYFQEFIENDGYDLKIVVVGDKLSFVARNTRKHDFRASGGGDCYYEKSLITPNIIETAFKTADALQLQCVGFDFVVNNKTDQALIIEMCYGFNISVIKDANGYYDREGTWHDEALNVPHEIIKNLIEQQ